MLFVKIGFRFQQVVFTMALPPPFFINIYEGLTIGVFHQFVADGDIKSNQKDGNRIFFIR